jgi:hypothetical protein
VSRSEERLEIAVGDSSSQKVALPVAMPSLSMRRAP